MGIVDKIKEFFTKLKEDNKGFALAMKRINASGFCGNVNRGIKDGDFWNGSYLSIEEGHIVIYGSNQEDYTFGADDVVSFEVENNFRINIQKGNQEYPALRFHITFKDGKKAQADILLNKIDSVKNVLGRN